MGSALWCVGDFEKFQKLQVPVLGIFPCTGEIDYFGKKIPVLVIFPCAGEIGFFGSKIPVLGIFPRWWSRKAVKKNLVIYLYQNEFFWTIFRLWA